MNRTEGSSGAPLSLFSGDATADGLPRLRHLTHLRPTLDHERRAWSAGRAIVAGIDEVGRGALAGPVMAAAVVLRDDEACRGLLATVRDSKALSPAARVAQDTAVRQVAAGVAVGAATAAEIDEVGIVAATELAMLRAVDGLPAPPDHLLVDGYPVRGWSGGQDAVVKGDRRILSIAAASVVAKVARDALMVELAATYPGYCFQRHKGYGTAMHLAAIHALGPSPHHRLSWSPLRGGRPS